MLPLDNPRLQLLQIVGSMLNRVESACNLRVA